MSPAVINSDRPETLLLLSGGLDSAACLHFLIEKRRPLITLFINYGQPAIRNEGKASRAIANHYGVQYRVVRCSGTVSKQGGLIRGRNLFLIALALLESPDSVTGIALGIHSGTDYKDCSPSFLAATSRLVQSTIDDRISIIAPFSTWTKRQIYRFATLHDVPIELTWSCENGKVNPCGSCLSCQDREFLDAEATQTTTA